MIEPKSGPIIAAHKHIKRKNLMNNSKLKFTPSRFECSKTALLLLIRGLPHRVDRFLVLLLQLSNSF